MPAVLPETPWLVPLPTVTEEGGFHSRSRAAEPEAGMQAAPFSEACQVAMHLDLRPTKSRDASASAPSVLMGAGCD